MISAFSTLKIRILLEDGGLATTRSGLTGRTYTCLIPMTSLTAGQIQNLRGCSAGSAVATFLTFMKLIWTSSFSSHPSSKLTMTCSPILGCHRDCTWSVRLAVGVGWGFSSQNPFKVWHSGRTCKWKICLLKKQLQITGMVFKLLHDTRGGLYFRL